MKWYYHALIVTLLTTFTFFTYADGLGAIPFLIAAVYLGITSVFEFKKIKNEKG